MSNGQDELEVTWKEAIVAYSTYFPRIDLEELRKITKPVRIASVPAEIKTKHIQNTNPETATPKFLLN